MVVYNFKKMETVPTATAMMDAVLSKTQRKTPTVVHPNYNIVRIRQFYMRKVKYTQTSYQEVLTQILTDFPRLEDIHPFYADLVNVLYDRDHFKLALGQLNIARQIIDSVSKDYIKLLKYADSLYRCKCLKKAALGRMCTVIKRQKGALEYLEQVRMHMMRLPSIDPTTRTIIVAGYPNVGKSSFVNKVTRANVEVQPYAFTTKSLYVGHMDYKYLRWQVIDTPGVLDRPIEERNTVEMQSITALAHLQCAVLYVLDISEQCGYDLKEQVELFESIRPLFHNKPLIVAVNKVDVRTPDQLTPTEQALLQKLTDAGATITFMSTFSEEGLMQTKNTCCDLLLAQRVEQKLQGKKVESVINRIRVAEPTARAGAPARPSFVPQSVLDARAAKAAAAAAAAAPKRQTQKDLQEEHGGAGVYSLPLQAHWELKRPEWLDDMIPEIMDGKNIADFIDPEIEAKLEELEREEDERAQLAEMQDDELDDEDVTAVRQLASKIRQKKGIVKATAWTKRKNNGAGPLPGKIAAKQRSVGQFVSHMGKMGVKLDAAALPNLKKKALPGAPGPHAVERFVDEEGGSGGGAIRARSRSRTRGGDGDDAMGEGEARGRSVSRGRSNSVPRDRSATRRDSAKIAHSQSPQGLGLRDDTAIKKAGKLTHKNQAKISKMGRATESDRRIPTKMPKHLYSGKRGNGKTDRR